MRPPVRPMILSNVNTIVEHLETAYPARPLFPEGSRAVQSLFVHHIQEVLAKPLLPILVPLSHQRLSERSQLHFRSRSQAAPQTPSHIAPGPQLEQHWWAVKQQFDFLAGILDKNAGSDGDGMVTMGYEVTYADFALCSVLIWIEQVAPHDGWARVRQWNGGRWSRLWERCREYMDVY
jgi:glutathione S-transferase